ncbi:MAG: hypothetical protein K0S32_1440 [Bacteroidetes bacterium]|nr:hypothetical protein [Bacteroidota bacterium]
MNAQPLKKIKVKKNQTKVVYFYQKGLKSDTIVKSKNDLFYLLLSDTLKDHIIIQIENGQLQKTANDSLFRLVYIRGINYESSYTKTLIVLDEMEAHPKKRYDFKTAVNGTSSAPANEIHIQFKVKNMVKPLLENVFYYKS